MVADGAGRCEAHVRGKADVACHAAAFGLPPGKAPLHHEPMSRASEPRPCPKCRAIKVVPILYGEPTSEAGDLEAKGDLVLGGCCITGDDPRWRCLACSTDFRRAPRGPRRG